MYQKCSSLNVKRKYKKIFFSTLTINLRLLKYFHYSKVQTFQRLKKCYDRLGEGVSI